MTTIKDKNYDEERALYGKKDIKLVSCSFCGKKDGESALKECEAVTVDSCSFLLRYPLWHDKHLAVKACTFAITSRASLWYSFDIDMEDSFVYSPKAFRECKDARIKNCDIVSEECLWRCSNVCMEDSSITAQYFALNATKLFLKNVVFSGKYSFQYITDSTIENCTLNTKDALWHAKNIKLKNCTIIGEYLAWYSSNLCFENCVISGTQAFCYCENLILVDCTLDSDLCFEKSEVNAKIKGSIKSIKNMKSGKVIADSVEEIIKDSDSALGCIECRL